MSGAFAAIALAAGSSRRAGPGVNKLTIEFEGKPLVCHAVDALLDACCAPVVVVTGQDAAALRAVLANRGPALHFAHNAQHAEGMGASIRCGAEAVSALSPELAGVFVLPGDMPRIRPEHVRALGAAFPVGTPNAICAPTQGGRRGHPVLFSAALLTALCRLSGDRGARSVIEENAARVIAVPIDDPAIHFDVDRPAREPGRPPSKRP